MELETFKVRVNRLSKMQAPSKYIGSLDKTALTKLKGELS